MAKRRLAVCAVFLSGFMAGCRCCPLLNPYADCLDDVSDSHVYFDRWYHPRWDVSRAGKADWCGTSGLRHRWCRCCEQNEGNSDIFDECHLYPPSYPYEFPGQALVDSVNAQPPDNSLEPSDPGPTPAPDYDH